MDAISFYGTLGAIILLQISFYWLFRDDHYKRQLTQDEIGQQKLSILLAGPSESFTCRSEGEPDDDDDDAALSAECSLWRRRLEQIGFIIYELRLGEQEEQLSFNRTNRVMRIAASKQDHIDQAVCLIDRELKRTEQKFHAFVSLPRWSSTKMTNNSQVGHYDENKMESETNKDGQAPEKSTAMRRNCCNNELINLIRDDHLQSYRLLLAFNPTFNRDSRIIQVQKQPDEATTMAGRQSDSLRDERQSSLLNLELGIESLVNEHLRSELVRLNCGQLIEVAFRDNSSRPRGEARLGESEASQRITGPEGQTRKGGLAKNNNANLGKLYDELQKLLVLVNPKDRIFLI